MRLGISAGSPADARRRGSVGLGILPLGRDYKKRNRPLLVASARTYTGFEYQDGIRGRADRRTGREDIDIRTAQVSASGLGERERSARRRHKRRNQRRKKIDSRTEILNVKTQSDFSATEISSPKSAARTPGANVTDQLNVTGCNFNKARLAPCRGTAFRGNRRFVRILRNDETDRYRRQLLNGRKARFSASDEQVSALNYIGATETTSVSQSHKALRFSTATAKDISVSPSEEVNILSASGAFRSQFGANGDQPAPADFDGDNKNDIAFYAGTTGYGLFCED